MSVPLSLLTALFIGAAIPHPHLRAAEPSAPNKPTQTWYVDCSRATSARADGRSPRTAWTSSAQASAQPLQPGDRLLFKRGTVCAGMLTPQGSGTPDQRIHLDAWGEGARPEIRANPGQPAALKLWNQQYWTIQHLSFAGGNPHGVYISGDRGVLRGIRVIDTVIHHVEGEPADKEGGLLVIAPAAKTQRFDDVLVDGVTAHHTTQWAGILVGVARGYVDEAERSTNVIVRNSIVHDVAGDGIILFQVNNAVIENSVAWRIGLQDKETLGTPNGIWTWMCRDCVVRRCEAFLTDSPGIDGGAFDIDYGNTNNVVEDSYGHDTQGYCFAVFGAGKLNSTNSVVRNLICHRNGLDPALARRQGAVFLSTWDGGKLTGVHMEGSHIDWAPPVDTAAIVNNAELTEPGVFTKNEVRSSVPSMINSTAMLRFDANRYLTATANSVWTYGKQTFPSWEDYRKQTAQDRASDWQNNPAQPSRLNQINAAMRLPALKTLASSSQREGGLFPWKTLAGHWALFVKLPVPLETLTEHGDPSSRAALTWLKSAGAKYPNQTLSLLLAAPPERNTPAQPSTPSASGLGTKNQLADLDLPSLLFVHTEASSRAPEFFLIHPNGSIAWHHQGLPHPGDLGEALHEALLQLKPARP